jgi:hypothetical protein
MRKWIETIKRLWNDTGTGKGKRKPRRAFLNLESLEERAVPTSYTWSPATGCGNGWTAGCTGGTTNWLTSGVRATTYPGGNLDINHNPIDGDIANFNNTSVAECIVDGTPAGKVVIHMETSYSGGTGTNPHTLSLQNDLNLTGSGPNASYIKATNQGDNDVNVGGANMVHGGNLNVYGILNLDGTDVTGNYIDGGGSAVSGNLDVKSGGTLNAQSGLSHNMTFSAYELVVDTGGTMNVGYSGGNAGNIDFKQSATGETPGDKLQNNGDLKLLHDNTVGSTGGNLTNSTSKDFYVYNNGGTITRTGVGVQEIDMWVDNANALKMTKGTLKVKRAGDTTKHYLYTETSNGYVEFTGNSTVIDCSDGGTGTGTDSPFVVTNNASVRVDPGVGPGDKIEGVTYWDSSTTLYMGYLGTATGLANLSSLELTDAATFNGTYNVHIVHDSVGNTDWCDTLICDSTFTVGGSTTCNVVTLSTTPANGATFNIVSAPQNDISADFATYTLNSGTWAGGHTHAKRTVGANDYITVTW